MLIIPFSVNCFVLKLNNKTREKNILVDSLEKWWIIDKYMQGMEILEECKKKLNVEKY